VANQGKIIKNLSKNDDDKPITKKDLKELLLQKNNA
jgi:hypothetical protein